MKIIVGLGNPGEEYENTRHNIGFMTVDHIGSLIGKSREKKYYDILLSEEKIKKNDIVLAKPLTFMNKSGEAVVRLIRKYGISSKDLLVIHDDMDLDLGKIKLKSNGGSAGHKGIKSIIDSLSTEDFCRLRIGIGKPESTDASSYVLNKFKSSEQKILRKVIEIAYSAVGSFVEEGIEKAMNRFNAHEAYAE